MGISGRISGARLRVRVTLAVLATTAIAFAATLPAQASAKSSTHNSPHKFGALDCNGFSQVQHSVKLTGLCTDVHGTVGVNNYNNWGGHFYDNGHYIGHDEPDMTFLSTKPGSGNDVTWTETLPKDPSAAPTVNTPGSDVAHWFELSAAPWFSMALCNGSSYPLLPCTPQSDKNAPHGTFPGGGSSFLETQFYPPGFAPFVDGLSCDNTHWCASLHINDLECKLGFVDCNPKCTEPTNFAFVQTDGVPTGPPNPQDANLATNTPNSHTLLMNPGDRLVIHIFNAPVPGHPGHNALKLVIEDLTTGQTGFMQASGANGFKSTSYADCSGEPFDYQPEYNTSVRENIVPWAALQTNISTQYEIGHFEACSSVTDPVIFSPTRNASDTTWLHCHGPYETTTTSDGGSSNPEVTDAPCFPAGDTHGVLNSAPDTVTGCVDFLTQNGDLDFDGSPYWPEWPTGTSPTSLYPGSFVQSQPVTGGQQYSRFFIQTDAALSESTCTPKGEHCAIPPPNAPGKFYPYWSRATSGGPCTILFGNVASAPGINDLGKDAQYGTDQVATFGYNEFIGPILPNNTC
jgi:hypothetical protein